LVGEMDRNHSLPQLTNTAEFVESEGGKLKSLMALCG